jgi:hypothetical protein
MTRETRQEIERILRELVRSSWPVYGIPERIAADAIENVVDAELERTRAERDEARADAYYACYAVDCHGRGLTDR